MCDQRPRSPGSHRRARRGPPPPHICIRLQCNISGSCSLWEVRKVSERLRQRTSIRAFIVEGASQQHLTWSPHQPPSCSIATVSAAATSRCKSQPANRRSACTPSNGNLVFSARRARGRTLRIGPITRQPRLSRENRGNGSTAATHGSYTWEGDADKLALRAEKGAGPSRRRWKTWR